jgi:hypothetical protein
MKPEFQRLVIVVDLVLEYVIRSAEQCGEPVPIAYVGVAMPAAEKSVDKIPPHAPDLTAIVMKIADRADRDLMERLDDTGIDALGIDHGSQNAAERERSRVRDRARKPLSLRKIAMRRLVGQMLEKRNPAFQVLDEFIEQAGRADRKFRGSVDPL